MRSKYEVSKEHRSTGWLCSTIQCYAVDVHNECGVVATLAPYL